MQITIDALAELEVEARAIAWDDADFDWSSAAGIFVRSTWDYHRHVDAFRAWIDRVSGLTHLDNPADVIRWNIDKRYLAELGRAGIPVIETLFVDPAETGAGSSSTWRHDLEQLAGSGDVVVKPCVSAGSNDTLRHGDVASAAAHVDALLGRGRAVMIQPYLDRVDVEAETGLVYIDGEFSHAFSKGPMLANPGNARGDLYLAETIDARVPTDVQRALGDRVMVWLADTWGSLLYARVDMLPTNDGPVIIEVELTEPSLYLHLDSGAPARFAEAIARRVS